MVEIQIKDFEKSFKLTSKMHCERDICLAVTAYVNAIVLYVDQIPEEKISEKSVHYQSGDVEVEVKFKLGEYRREFMHGIESTVMGLKAYAEKYPTAIMISGARM